MRYIRLLPCLLVIHIQGCSGIDNNLLCESPEHCVDSWIQALKEKDLERVNRCFTERAKNRPEYCGNNQALLFWRDEMMDDRYSLELQGFKGEYHTHYGIVNHVKVAFVHPILPDGHHGSAIWLIVENGSWKISKLFIMPPNGDRIDGK